MNCPYCQHELEEYRRDDGLMMHRCPDCEAVELTSYEVEYKYDSHLHPLERETGFLSTSKGRRAYYKILKQKIIDGMS